MTQILIDILLKIIFGKKIFLNGNEKNVFISKKGNKLCKLSW